MELRTLLLVDDNQHFRRSLAISLEELGHKTLEAGDSIECFEKLMQFQEKGQLVDGVVIDGRMPALDGYWLADQIEHHWPRLPLVILTAYPRPANHRNHRVLTKPIDPEELIRTIETIHTEKDIIQKPKGFASREAR